MLKKSIIQTERLILRQWSEDDLEPFAALNADSCVMEFVSLIAMVLGSGIPLFSFMNREHKCRLVTSQDYPSGLVQLKYEVIK